MKNKKLIRKTAAIAFAVILAGAPLPGVMQSPFVIVSEAHSGRTDKNGGHKDNKNASGLGSYHYHCGGNPAHLHENGVCPYQSGKSLASNGKKTSSAVSKNTKNSTKSTSNTDKETIKKVQNALNDLGYDCGTADGIAGKKTKQAIKDYQKDNGLTVDGIIGKELKKSLKIS